MERKCTNQPFLVLMQTSKAIHEKIRDEMTQNNLSITEFSVLEALFQKGKQTIQQVGSSILISSGSMTYVIDKLEQKSLLKRNACPEDRRVVHVTLTEAGNDMMKNIMHNHQNLIDSFFKSLSDEEALTMVKLLKKVKNRVET